MMTMWEDIVGYTCLDCGRWATHWYGGYPICCTCHIGGIEGYNTGDDWMQVKAIKMNTLYQKGLPLDQEED